MPKIGLIYGGEDLGFSIINDVTKLDLRPTTATNLPLSEVYTYMYAIIGKLKSRQFTIVFTYEHLYQL